MPCILHEGTRQGIQRGLYRPQDFLPLRYSGQELLTPQVLRGGILQGARIIRFLFFMRRVRTADMVLIRIMRGTMMPYIVGSQSWLHNQRAFH